MLSHGVADECFMPAIIQTVGIYDHVQRVSVDEIIIAAGVGLSMGETFVRYIEVMRKELMVVVIAYCGDKGQVFELFRREESVIFVL